MKLRTTTIIILLYTFYFQAVSQKKGDQRAIIEITQPLLEVHSQNNIQQLMGSNIRAFCPVPYPSGTGNSLNQTFQSIKEGLPRLKQGPVVLINKHFDNSEWDKALLKSGLSKKLYTPVERKGISPSDLADYDKNIISFNTIASDISFGKNHFLSNFSSSDSILTEEELTRDLLIVNIKDFKNDTLRDANFLSWIQQNGGKYEKRTNYLLRIWKTSGKRPHFLLTSPDKAEDAIRLSAIINKMPYFRARVLNNQKLYAPVFSENDPEFRSGGRISFPSPPDHQVTFSPRTRGLRFSPDILIFTPENSNREVTFRGFPLSPADKRVVWFHFNNEYSPASPQVKNLIHPTDSLLVNDPIRGEVFKFKGHEDFLDCGSSLDIDFSQPISISAWIKPEKTDMNRGIVGMGRSFSFKIHEGQLTFTTADIKDHRLANGRIIPDQWQHVAVVFEPRMKISLYLNGKKMGHQQASDIQSSDHSIIIGSNIWGEFFDGYIDDLMIWNRALSDEEIASLVNKDNYIISKKPTSKEPPTQILIYLLGFVALASLVILTWIISNSKKKYKANEASSTSLGGTAIPEPHTNLLKILTFGGFKIVTQTGKELASVFSPREKQLFVYLLWYSLRSSEKGVSSKQLSNDLWPGMSSARAKNNRSTYVQHLRRNLEETGIEILYSSDRKWQVKLPDSDYVICDLSEYIKIKDAFIKNPYGETLSRLTSLLESGPFLKDADSEILDHFKSEIENEIIQTLTSDQTIDLAVKSKTLVPALLNVIRQYDPLNEVALSLEITWLTQNGHHGRALDAFKRFNRDYQNYYGEPFQKEMSEFC